MPREAFARARRFLQFKRRHAWGAKVAGVVLGFIFLGYLGVAGLLIDLFASQGRLPPTQTANLTQWAREHLPAASGDKLLAAHRSGEGVGLVALAVRNEDSWCGPLFGALARAWPWTWTPFTYLTGLIAIFLLLGLASFAVSLLTHHWAAQAVLDASSRLRRTVYLHSLRLGRLTIHGISGGGEAVGAFTRDLEAVQEGLYHWLTSTFCEPTRFILALLFALTVDCASGVPWVTATTLALAVLLWLAAGWAGNRSRIEEKTEAAAAAEQMHLMREALSLTRLVKGFGMDAFNRNRLERQLHRYALHQNRRLMARIRGRLALQILALVALAALMFAVGWALIAGHSTWTQALVVLIALGSLYPSLRRLVQRQKVMELAYRSAGAVFRFLDTEGDVRQVVGAEFLAPMASSLEFDQVTLKDPSRPQPLLDKVSFKINAGERIAFVGQDEDAKRAIAFLIARFLDPTSGEIRIDGRRLPWMTLESIRAQVGLVVYDDLVFNDSIFSNIACGDPAFTLPKVVEAAKMAHAHKFIMNLDQGYETPVGEMGQNLSVGERFRIALARVILRDPALVIIEEPPFAELDEATRNLIDDSLDRFLVGRTALFIPHRPSTTQRANRVYLLHDGALEAVGSHRDLLLKSERYRHLQYLEFNVFAEAD